eukprot:708346-Prymnesium_polylepis.1
MHPVACEVESVEAPGPGWRVALRLAGRLAVAEGQRRTVASRRSRRLLHLYFAPLYAFYAPHVALASPTG